MVDQQGKLPDAKKCAAIERPITIGWTILVMTSMGALVFAVPYAYKAMSTKGVYEASAEWDPKLGAKVALPSKDVLGRFIPETSKVLVYLGSCISCAVESFEPSALHVPDGFVPVLVARGLKSDLAALALNAPRCYVVADTDRSLESKLNLTWYPRYFVLTPLNEVRWLQPNPKEMPQGVLYGK